MSKWIPVSAELPEKGKKVLAFGKHRHLPKKFSIRCCVRFTDEGFWADDDGRTTDYRITHWMPLPKAPEV